MKKRIAALWFLLLGALPLLAHHSFSAEYNITQPIVLKGTITSIEWTNPHAIVTIDAPDSTGPSHEWRGEGGALSLLTDSGWTPEMLQKLVHAHDPVIASGYRARGAAAADHMWVKAIELPDGRKLVFN